MSETYDIETDPGKVRLLISDIGGADGKSYIFNDAEIETFLVLSDGSIRMAAAEALRTIAGNEAQVQKRITFLDLKTDGPAVAKSLLELAGKLEERDDAGVGMDFAAMDVDQFSHREMVESYFMRNT